MWSFRRERLEDQSGIKIVVDFHAAPLSYARVLQLWQNDTAFRAFFNALLADAPFGAFRWEAPPISTANLQQPFEFVLLNDESLARTSDASAFEAHFSQMHDGVAAFDSLGRDATLIAPTPQGDTSAYGHLAAFVRHAPESQQHALWRRVGKEMQTRLSEAPIWLNTAGAGVPWLHVRLDSRPKYYAYEPYRVVA